jgi:hypothetical protein
VKGFEVSPDAIKRAAHGVGSLASRVDGFQQATAKALESVSGSHPWGLIGKPMQWEFQSLATEFQKHLDHMTGAIKGAQKRLGNTAAAYTTAELAILETLGRAGQVGDETHGSGLRQLNPASQFYLHHHFWNGAILASPNSLGMLGATALDALRLTGDAESNDKYNVATDIAMLTADGSMAALSVYSDVLQVRTDPLGWLIRCGVGFLLNAFYWTKIVTDSVTGDPIATGQAAYNFDSIAQGCRSLAHDLEQAVGETIGNGSWHGEAADAARKRLTALRNGITATADCADMTAALLQLASTIITDLEFIVRGLISDLITWVIMTWFAAQLLAAETFGTSEAAAVARITSASATTLGRVQKLITLATTMVQRVLATASRLITRLGDVKQRSFAALLRSPAGQKHMNADAFGGARFNASVVRKDAGRGKHARIKLSHLYMSWGKQIKRGAVNNTLHTWGFHGYLSDEKGKAYPDGKPRIKPMKRMIPDGNGGMRGVTNYAAIVGYSLKTVLPFGRALQYRLRAGDTPSDREIDQDLDLWGAPG